jgi:hypothetical protein
VYLIVVLDEPTEKVLPEPICAVPLGSIALEDLHQVFQLRGSNVPGRILNGH